MKNFIYFLTSMFLFILLLTGCMKSTTLPNGYVVEKGERYFSRLHLGSSNIRSKESDLVTKSRVTGVISFIGFLDIKDNTVSINNVTQKAYAGDGGLLGSGGNGINNLTIFDNGGVILKINVYDENSEIKEYLMQLKDESGSISPAISLQYLKEGNKISIPTIREYITRNCNCTERLIKHYRSYRILNKVDYIYIQEITPVDTIILR